MRRGTHPAVLAGLMLVAWLTLPAGRATARGLSLVASQGGSACLVIPDRAGPWEVEAAEELSRVLGVMTGACPQVVKEKEFAGGPAVAIGATRAAAARAIVPSRLAPDGYVMVTAGDTLFLVGRNPWGTAYAVADFLERVGGVRWCFPGPLGEVIPRRSELCAPALREVCEPDFSVRDFIYARVWGLAAAAKQEAFRKWAWHNRVTVQGDAAGPYGTWARHPQHAFFRLFPPEARQRLPSDFFAQVDGCRVKPEGDVEWQLCTSNRRVVEEVARQARESVVHDPGRPVFSVSPNDLRRFCECDRCRQLDHVSLGERLSSSARAVERFWRRRLPGRDRPRRASPLSERIFTFVAEVARRAPQATIGCYAYADYWRAPRHVAFPPNVEIWSCQSAGSYADEARKRESRAALDDWLALSVPVYVYEYYGHFRARVPRLFPHLIAEDLAHLRVAGVRGVHTEATSDWALHGLNYYVAARLLWDTQQDVDALIRDYTESLFGPAAEPMRAYLAGLERCWMEASRAGHVSAADLGEALAPYTRGALAELEGDLARASASATDVARERVELFRQGLFYARLYRKGEPIGAELRKDRDQRGIYVVAESGEARRVVAAPPSWGDPALLDSALALRKMEKAFLHGLLESEAFSVSSLETTDREYEGWLGGSCVSYLAWKYWPAGPGDEGEGGESESPRDVSKEARRRAERSLAERMRGGNLARATGAVVRAESILRPRFAPDAVRDGDRGGRGWASREGSRAYSPGKAWSEFPPRWVELEWPRPVPLGAVVIYWGEEGAYWTSRSYLLESWNGQEWETLVSLRGNVEERSTAHLFPTREVQRLRIWQAGGGGPPLRPNMMWVREIECY